MVYDGKDLSKTILKFFFKNIFGKNIKDWKKTINRISENSLITKRRKFKKYLSSLPSKSEIPFYNTDPEYFPGGASFPTFIPKGNQTIIEVSYSYCSEVIELIDQRIEELQTNKVKEFPKFGEWDNLDNPKLFILKRGVLACLVHSFDRVTVLLGLTYEEIYNDLSNILIKRDGSNYKSKTIKNFRLNNEKKKTLKECNKKVLFNMKESIEFVRYLLEKQKTL